MRDLTTLDKGLLQSEFELARALHDLIRSQGYSSVKAAAMIYRHGYLDGGDKQKKRVGEAYKKYQELKASLGQSEQSLPEAIEEGSAGHE